ncbi:diaminopimelate epimerase [Patulibacter brassicae]|uniref:Diaminopimelate epimerase n=1 Tax=Patulibacter brassicae TaxID=1705717 RepID=A0ABU4VE61_9ACTN|nr:diaminopimelate epimerase [Patulibacter brassicae]MDX8150086.1 diaminopimelate epimerase [Patulibacter brassicae]
MRFEKWQALGNDYLIVERERLPFPLTAARARRLCDPHLGPGADGVLELAPPTAPGTVAALRILNPDGSEAELSGNGAREAIMYLVRRGWTDQRQFSITTVAGEIRPTVLSDTTCRVDMGRASLVSDDLPGGAPDGRGTLTADVVGGGPRDWAFQHVKIGNPQCAIAVGSIDELEALDLPAIGPAIERHARFPNRTNVSWYAELEPGRIRARIFERGVGETMSSGTGASGAAVAYALAGGGRGEDGEGEQVTVVLDGGELVVDVGEDLHVDLTGWAVPVYVAEATDDLLRDLAALD